VPPLIDSKNSARTGLDAVAHAISQPRATATGVRDEAGQLAITLSVVDFMEAVLSAAPEHIKSNLKRQFNLLLASLSSLTQAQLIGALLLRAAASGQAGGERMKSAVTSGKRGECVSTPLMSCALPTSVE